MGRISKWFEELFEFKNGDGDITKCSYIKYDKKIDMFIVENTYQVEDADTAIKLAFKEGATEVHFVNL